VISASLRFRTLLRAFWLAARLGFGVSTACQSNRTIAAAATAHSATPASVAAPRPGASDRLPEDPAAGVRSLARWKAHLEDEERERKAVFDRRHLAQHRQVLAFLRQAQARYDAATSEGKVRALKRDFGRASTSTRQRIESIDRWGNSSNVLGAYATLLQSLAEDYPAACLLALSGERLELESQRRGVEASLHQVDDWLAFAAEAEEE
jgi:hypothetical protein